jgi:virulence-associated protein VagC
LTLIVSSLEHCNEAWCEEGRKSQSPHDRREIDDRLELMHSVQPLSIIHNASAMKRSTGFRFETPTVSIRRQGDAVILEPVKPHVWLESFFEAIRIDDPAFNRPDRGSTPAAPSWE